MVEGKGGRREQAVVTTQVGAADPGRRGGEGCSDSGSGLRVELYILHSALVSRTAIIQHPPAETACVPSHMLGDGGETEGREA